MIGVDAAQAEDGARKLLPWTAGPARRELSSRAPPRAEQATMVLISRVAGGMSGWCVRYGRIGR